MPRLCSRCALTRVAADRTECRACADDSAKHKGFEWQVRKFLEDHEDLRNFTYADTALPCAARNASNARRADFAYVLEDRVVFLEVDENEHRYNSPDCERRREQQLADSVPEGKHVVLVRYNPLTKWTAWMINLERLGKALREAFVTEDVRLADDGVHRMYVGYQMAQIRKLDAAYENVQRRAIEEARARENSEEEEAGDVRGRDSGIIINPQVETESSKLIREIADMERELKRKRKLLTRALAAEEEGGNGEGAADTADDGGEEDVAMNPEHLDMFKSTFCYLKKPGKYYEYKTGVQYNELEFINRNKMERTVVRHYDEAKKKTVTKKYESARLWIKNHEEDIKTFYDLTYVPRGSRVLPHPEGPEFGDLLNTWKRSGSVPVPNGDCSLFYEWFEMLIPDEETREWILDTMAYKYHNPAKKPGVCVQLLAKAQGIGKTFVFETMCEALFGRDSKGGTFVQLDGTKKDQFVGKFNAHLSRCDAVLIDELSQENGMGSVYEQMKKLITDEAVMTRGMFKDYVAESSYMLWMVSANKGEGEYAIPIESTADRRQCIVRCEEGFLHLPDPSKFEEAFKRQMYEEGGMGKLVSDIKSRPLRAEDRPDGLDFKPSVVERFPEKVKLEREKAFAELRERQATGEPSEDPFFAELAKDVHDRSFVEKLLKSPEPGPNGMYAFDWSVLAQNECHHETSRSLYERYKKRKGGNFSMSVYSFARRLGDAGLWKAQKRSKTDKKVEVVWVGFKRKGAEPPLKPPSSPMVDGDSERLTKRSRLEWGV